MLTHRGFSAWIVVDGKPVPEYLVAINSETNRVSCWIPSEEGQNFSVYWRDLGGKVDTCSFIILDGFVVPGRFLYGSGVAFRQGVRTSKDTERLFVFQKSDGNGDLHSSSSASKEAGMITLKIKRINRVASRPANSLQDISLGPRGQRTAGDICVGFGQESKGFEQCPNTWDVKPHDDDVPGAKNASTYVSFVFRYRSRAFLQAQGIIEDSSPSLPSRTQVRRIVSAPVVVRHGTPSALPSPVQTPSPQGPNQGGPKTFTLGPYPLRRPSAETRRTVSWRAIPTKADTFPGQGLMFYSVPCTEQDESPSGSHPQ